MEGPSLPWRIAACSFDLFDTLLGRTLVRPVDLFLEVERRLRAAALPCRDFAGEREAVEFELRQRGGFQREVSLEQIHDALAGKRGQPESWKRQAMAMELEAERETLFAVPAGLAQLHRARRRGKRILFVSDTYFPKSFLEPILVDLGILTDGDRLHLSVESGRMKSTGELFAHVAHSEHLEPSRIFHIGDNEESDVHQARAAGWKASLFRPTEPVRYEVPGPGIDDPDDRLSLSLLRGTQRRLRLESPAADRRTRIIRETTLGVSGPLAVSYAAWCLREAHRRGINRLYFFSRDGEILVRIARLINDRLKLPVALHYLYVSRQALLLPSLREPLDDELDWIMAPTAILTPRIVLKRVEIRPEELTDLLDAAGFGPTDWDRQLSLERRQEFRSFLLRPEIAKRITEQAQVSRESAVVYLEQSGLLADDPRFAVVDIGWRGTLQWCLSRLLSSTGRKTPLTGFYFGLRGTKKYKPEDILVPCFSDAFDPTVVDALDSIVPLLELFLAATHGGVSGYRLSSKGVEPTFRTEDNERGLEWGVGIQQQAMLDLTRTLCEKTPFSFDPEPLIRDTLLKLELFARCPSLDEARVYGSFLDAEDQNESVFTPLARAYTLRELQRVRTEGFRHHHNEWQHGAIALTPKRHRRRVGIVNSMEEKHPVCGPGVRPLAGFGPVEGPTPQFHLPRFFWAYGPECLLEIETPDHGPHRLTLEIKNYHGNQVLEFLVADRTIDSIEVPQNFGEQPIEPFQAEVSLPFPPGKHRLAIRSRCWATDDRPLAVIFSRIECIPRDPSP
ncbi:MAG: hypothetical protein R3F07_07525 [Opitutaceae bacterium]